MNENQLKTLTYKKSEDTKHDFKIIEINISDTTDSLYAVVTPVKNMK
ncbi:hypothetical protein [Litchfieldia salsa]|uniref:Uncharacterized protein n=1 Tax=Litchfieldia salsa TaxID=930152 RepID=A0A1H0URE8_9BACI|nr:hypothetical protein [Litchfieldia salsa]SDP68663.1 hypothetical protein SAMN05216565_105109 [Litchfieldia salsa]